MSQQTYELIINENQRAYIKSLLDSHNNSVQDYCKEHNITDEDEVDDIDLLADMFKVHNESTPMDGGLEVDAINDLCDFLGR